MGKKIEDQIIINCDSEVQNICTDGLDGNLGILHVILGTHEKADMIFHSYEMSAHLGLQKPRF